MAFQKGKSGNPTGRPKKSDAEREVEALARKHGPAAIRRLKFWMDSDNPKASVSASQTMLNRGFGMPRQAHEHSGNLTLSLADIIAQSGAE